MLRTTRVLLAIAAVLAVGVPAGASDQLVPGTRLSVQVSSNGREKLSFKSKGNFTIPVPGSADDPSLHSATLQLLNPNTSESFTFALPQAHWSVSAAGTMFRYRDSALAEAGKVKITMIKGRQLKVSGRKIGITLNETSQGALAVVLTAGAMRYCARFDDGSVKRDQPGLFNAKSAPAPGACPVTPGSTTTTSTTLITLPITTTTLTLPITTTTLTLPITTTTLTLPITTTTLTLPITTTTLTLPLTTTTLTLPLTTTTLTLPLTTTTDTLPLTTTTLTLPLTTTTISLLPTTTTLF